MSQHYVGTISIQPTCVGVGHNCTLGEGGLAEYFGEWMKSGKWINWGELIN